MFASFSPDTCAVLADVVVALHFVVLAYVIFGQFLILIGWAAGWKWIRNFWFRATHLLTIGVVAVEAMFDYPCPLTVWEADLKQLAGLDVENGSFIGRWMHQIVFFEGVNFDDPRLQFGYIVFAFLVLATFVFVPPKCPRCKTKSASPCEVSSATPT